MESGIDISGGKGVQEGSEATEGARANIAAYTNVKYNVEMPDEVFAPQRTSPRMSVTSSSKAAPPLKPRRLPIMRAGRSAGSQLLLKAKIALDRRRKG